MSSDQSPITEAQQKPVTIMLVEDNQAHAELTMRSFENGRLAHNIYHFVDGETALDFLFRRGPHADPEQSPRPDIILLDLHLPKVDGVQVLKEIKASVELRAIPVIILSTSSAERDIAMAYANYANSYLLKPTDFAGYKELISRLEGYWLQWNRNLPT